MPEITSVRVERRETFDLITKIGTGIHQKPAAAISGNGKLRLRTGPPGKLALTQPPAIQAGAIPLRETAPGGRTKDPDVHPCLNLWICVACYFTTDRDFFKQGC